MLKRLTAVAGVLTLTACAPGTPAALKSSPGYVYTFTADKDYRAVYRDLLDNARDCLSMGLITATVQVEGQLYDDIKKGQIVHSLLGGLGRDVYWVADIEDEGGPSKTTIYMYFNRPEVAKKTLEPWARGTLKGCDAGA